MQRILGYITLWDGNDDIKNRSFTGSLPVASRRRVFNPTQHVREAVSEVSQEHSVFLILQADAPFQLLGDFFFVFLNFMLL